MPSTAVNRGNANRDYFRNFPLVMLLLASSAGTGCYTHITQAKGPGAERYKVYDRNTDDIILGKWFGETPKDGIQAPPKK